MLLGGFTDFERVQFGRAVARIPAQRAPEALARVLALYRDERQEGESFRGFVARVGLERFREALAPLQQTPTFEEAPELYRDLGAEDALFRAEIGPGECAA